MEIISSKDIVSLTLTILETLDKCITNHSKKVGYILFKMLQYDNNYSNRELQEILLVGLLHDIGAYKTDININIIRLETEDSWKHSIFGSLFFKNIKLLQKYSDIILVHHMNYKLLKNIYSISEYSKNITEYLYMADKIDLYLEVNKDKFNKQIFNKFRDKSFSSKVLDTFENADNKYNILENINNGTYLNEIRSFFKKCKFTKDEKKQLIKMIIFLIDFKSNYTISETISSIYIALGIANVLKVNEKDKELLYYGMLFHDIGKLGIPTEIVNAPRKLTDEEIEIMKTHIDITNSILENYIPLPIRKIVARHHERLDGSGYPKGLKKEDLSLLERIASLSDIISELIVDKSYRKALSKSEIISLLKDEINNNKICSIAATAFIDNYDKIMYTTNKKRNEVILLYNNINLEFTKMYNNLKDLKQDVNMSQKKYSVKK